MEYPNELKYTKDHEWIRIEGDVAVVGVTDYAQHALGDIVFVELPKVGADVVKGKGAGVVESVKSVSDVFSPISGKVVDVNKALESSPETVNKSPYRDGWMFKVKVSDKKELETLMDSKDYQKLVDKK
ncbi:MAG: glycine cleavage system protein GcvH [Candidatus Altiarchaeota archaeon]